MSIEAAAAILQELTGHVHAGNIAAGKQSLARMKVSLFFGNFISLKYAFCTSENLIIPLFYSKRLQC